MIIGLTGSSGSGKSTASKIFAGFGLKVVDADAIYHDLLQNNDQMKVEISENFADVLYNNKIDRKKLGEIVFSNSEKLLKLNEITHKYVTIQVKNEIKNAKTDVILDVPLLFQAGYDEFCDKTIGIISKTELQIERICNRDNISIEDAKKRLENQKNNMFFCEKCDIIIKNDRDFASLKAECKRVTKEIGVQYGTIE